MQIKNLYWLSFGVLASLSLFYYLAISLGQASMRDSLRPKGPQDAVGIVSFGEPVKFEDYLVDGRWSLFAAVSRNSASSMETMHWLEPECIDKGVLLRKIVVKRFDAEVVSQLHIKRPLPSLWLYEGKELVSSNQNEVLRRIGKIEKQADSAPR